MNRARILDVVGTLVRLGLAGIWIVSGAVKIADPIQTAVAVDAYDVLPVGVVPVVAAVLPVFELALGALLLAGAGTRAAAVVSALLLLVFLAGLGQAWARGLSIDCGCFGGGGAVEPGEEAYGTELVRDLGFLALAGWLVVRPRTRFALDRRWDRSGDVYDGDDGPADDGGPTTQGRSEPAGTGRNPR
ncbi:MauE/DoxX family redox-associated membrane protein [Pseudonocardia sediminis]|uniref:MauE/DoxX family redox-associated membrane protein n=1 Tax=Pseudonocardia sediminis TaxID=1397368 RepID=UPI001F5E78BA|nr:MauE/DoxX family redox-associated membrane protein [Pseudonocardia sediminis]